jgi:hypothetical protein
LARSLLAGLLVAAIAGCSDDPDPDKPGAVDVLDVGTGQCLFVEADLKADVSTLPTIDCTKPHTHEIYSTVADTESDVFPGMAELEDFAERECYGDFEEYVGISPFDSTLFVTWIVPSLAGWNDEDDRDVLCVLGPRDGSQLDVSAKGLGI